jgi:uncharacterized protein
MGDNAACRSLEEKRLAMRINELSEKDCRAILGQLSLGRLACSYNDQPYVVPIYYVHDADHLYGFGTFGKKIEWMRANPKVCVEVDDITNHFQWSSVIVYGRYRELPDLPQFAEERDRARKLLEARSLWWQTAFETRRLKSEGDLIPPLFYAIDIDSVTGYQSFADAGETVVSVPTRRSTAAT